MEEQHTFVVAWHPFKFLLMRTANVGGLRRSPRAASFARRTPISAKSAHDSAHYFFRRLSCVPSSSTRPFSSLMRAWLSNVSSSIQRLKPVPIQPGGMSIERQ